MKKYIIFSISFVVVYTLIQFGSGLFLTLTFTPDMTGTGNMGTIISQETFILGTAFLSASIAYFIPKKFTKTTNNVN